MSRELIDPPEPRCEPDYDTLGDQRYDFDVEQALWDAPPVEPVVVEPLVKVPRVIQIKRTCPFCLDGRVVLSGYRIEACGCCNGKGYWMHEEEAE